MSIPKVCGVCQVRFVRWRRPSRNDLCDSATGHDMCRDEARNVLHWHRARDGERLAMQKGTHWQAPPTPHAILVNFGPVLTPGTSAIRESAVWRPGGPDRPDGRVRDTEVCMALSELQILSASRTSQQAQAGFSSEPAPAAARTQPEPGSVASERTKRDFKFSEVASPRRDFSLREVQVCAFCQFVMCSGIGPVHWH